MSNSNTGKTIATLLIGAAVGAALGYILATDKEARSESIERLREGFNDLKSKFQKKHQDLEEEIYNA